MPNEASAIKGIPEPGMGPVRIPRGIPMEKLFYQNDVAVKLALRPESSDVKEV